MPLYEYECEGCMNRFNKDISNLVGNLNKKNASRILKENPGFLYMEVAKGETGAPMFSLGEKTPSRSRSVRRFKYSLEVGKSLYLELKDFKFSELMEPGARPPKCPLCNGGKVRRVFSTFKAIFDKREREPGPGDDFGWHKDYKVQKDEERQNWVGQDTLNQHFKR
ncbi:hypothetical protein [Candidatus Mycalebacterium sp.]